MDGEKLIDESCRQRAAAWDAVVRTLNRVCPHWDEANGTGTQCAVRAIEALAAHESSAQGVGDDPVATVLAVGELADEGDGPAFSLIDWGRLRELPPRTKLYRRPPQKQSVIMKNAARYAYLRDRMSVEDLPSEHPAWSTPSEIESLRFDAAVDAAMLAAPTKGG